MNALPYEVKRAHWRGTCHAIKKFRAASKIRGKELLRDMTPARFDILYAIWRADLELHERRRQLGLPPVLRQAPLGDLHHWLGLAAPTISRTVHWLEDQGYVRLERVERDRRAKCVVLTWRGARLLRMAVQCLRQPNGMLACLTQHVADQDRIDRAAPRAPQRIANGFAARIDGLRSYARFFWGDATPIYDPRFVTQLREVWPPPAWDLEAALLAPPVRRLPRASVD